MKLSNLTFSLKVLGLSILLSPLSAYSQEVFTGEQAARMYEKAAIVRSSNHSVLPSYIKFKQGEEISFGQFEKWTKSAFKMNPEIGFKLKSTEKDELGHTHYRYNQTINGIVIEHATWIVHTKNESIYSMNGMVFQSIAAGNQAISEDAALNQALSHVNANTYKWELPIEEGHLKMETGDGKATYYPKGELVYVSKHATYSADSYRLAYKFNVYAHQPVSRAELYVDAITGEIIYENEVFHNIDVAGSAQTAYSGTQSIIADSFSGQFRLRETTRGNGVNTYDMNEGTSYGASVDFVDNDNIWDNANTDLDEYATDAHWGAEMTYDYYWLEHGRNSIDDNGFALNSYVHYDVQYANAFWDGQRMTYGDGNGTSWSPLTALDIAGHEVSHGLTTFTADLVYNAESGALNESFSDIFGTSIENFARPANWNWLIGEDIGSPLRSMENPNAYGDPDTYFGTNWASLTGGDNGGVHTNSGVQNFWYYLLVTGGIGTNDNGDNYNIGGLGFDEASDIAFRNLTVYLTDNSTFADARFYSIQSAVDLFGGCTPQVEATTNAWYAVGVGPEYVSTIIADFSAPISVGCSAPFNVDFSNLSSNGTSFTWDFGDGNTSTDISPSHTYNANGLYTVQLIADGGLCGIDTTIFVDYISVDPVNPCVVNMPDGGVGPTQTICDGTLFDSGGAGNNYGADEDAQITISPLGAATVDLNFVLFDIEPGQSGNCNYDYLEVYDGPTASSPFIGAYCNDNPPTTLSSTGGSITLVFHSDGGLQLEGFQIDWNCNYPTVPPTANWSASNDTTCNGEISFTDLSDDGPSQWLWDFGDGNTSTDQHPVHNYTVNGDYTVTLTVTNLNGNDAITVVDAIHVDLPAAPAGTGETICANETADLSAIGSGGTLNWYDAPNAGNYLASGSSFTTSPLTTTTSFYVDEDIPGSASNVGPADNTFGGGGFFNGNQHLVFDCTAPVILSTVKVYANGGGDRTIELRDAFGTVLQSITVNIPDGEQIVTLNFNIPVGNDLQLGTLVDSGQDLYRNNTGPTYPYTSTNGEIIITQSSPGLDWYYFFYDWVILEAGCTSERTEVIATVNPNADASINPILPLCSSDSPIALNAADAGGTWSGTGVTGNDFDPASAGIGTHTITYTIGGSCGATDNIDVSVADSYDATITATTVLCEDDASINLAAVDAGGVWSGTGITNTSTGEFDPSIAGIGTHTITYTISGSCGSTDSEDVIIEARPNASINAAGPFCRYESIQQLTSTTTGGVWSADCIGCIDAVTGEFDPAASGAGVWVITYTFGGNCPSEESIAIAVNECLGIGDNLTGFVLYPNPSKGAFILQSNEPISGQVVIQDLSGRTVHSSLITNTITEFNLAHLADGSYLFIFNNLDGDQIFIQKILKQ